MQVIEIISVSYEKDIRDSNVIPAGFYSGILGGYEVVFRAPGFTRIIGKTDVGVRGINIRCTVTVTSENIKVTY